MTLLRRLFRKIFGVVDWSPPGWLRLTGLWVGGHRLLSAVLAVALAGGGWTYNWYRHLPPPHTVSAKVEDIPVTRLQDVLQPAPLRIHFGESSAPLRAIGERVNSNITLDPAIPGYWKWDSDRDLVFYPGQDWPADTTYRITLNRKLLAHRILLASYRLETKTPAFRASINKLQFYQDPKDDTMKKVVCTLEFTHSIAPGEIEKNLTVAMLGRSPVFPAGMPKFSVDLTSHNRIAYIHTPKLALQEQEDFMKLVLAKTLATTQGGAKLVAEVTGKVRIPNMTSFFTVDGAEATIVRKDDGEPEQFVIINTSADALSADVAKGLEIYLLPDKAKKADAADGDADDSQDSTSNSDDDDNEEDAPAAAEPQWKTASEVDRDILLAAKPVAFTVLPSKDETSCVHTFKIHVERNGCLYIRVKKGTKAVGDYALAADYNNVVPVPVPAMEISIEGKGGLLALSGERKVSVVSRGVEELEYTISRVPADEINHLVSQTSGEFQNPEFLHDSFDENDIARIVREKQAIASPDRFKKGYSTFDFGAHMQPATDGGSPLQGLFFLNIRAVDPKTKKYIRGVGERRFILVTDLGLLVKENGDDSRDIFVQALAEHAGLAGASVEVLSRNGVPAETGTTGTDGRVSFPAIGKVTREKEPTAIVVRNGNDVVFIPYDRADRLLDYSRFEIDGQSVKTGADLDAFLFTERGAYRPGDEMHIGYTVKQADWGGTLTGMPLEAVVTDARNAEAQVSRISLPQGGFGEFIFQTKYDSPTGDYSICIYTVKNGKRGDLLGSTSAVVKEFQPDRMKIDAHLSKQQINGGWITPDQVTAAVTLRNLYGTPATNRRITGKINLCPSAFNFESFPGYTFFDSLRLTKHTVNFETADLGEETSDDNGAVSFDLDLDQYSDATYFMTFETEGFEADGGRSVSTAVSTLVSPLPYVVGYHSDGELDYVKTNHGQTLDFIAIDQGMKKIAVQDLKLTVTQRNYISVLTKQDDGTYAYESIEKDQQVSSDAVTIPADGLKWKIPSASPGTYQVELSDANGNKISQAWFTVVGEGNTMRPLDRNAELNVKLDRPSYNAGDEIEVNIVAPYAGSGLITIERDKVYASQWFTTDKTSTVQKIRMPEGLDGTGYVNVSFIRALDSKEIYMSPLSYGVVPFQANRDRRHLGITLDTVQESKPGEPLKIGYKSDKPGRIVVFAVDEGILQVTSYKTPDPLDHYFQKQALSVTTSQIVDLILPEFSILRAAATGGDGEANRQLNPFRRITDKPVVFWSGILDTGTTEQTVTYNVPDYFDGDLKIMAVAVSDEAAGCADKDTTIRGPFVLTPAVPTFVAPGDVFEVGLTAANNVIGSGTGAQVKIEAQTSEHLELVPPLPTGLIIPEGREKTVVFTFRAKDQLGSASILFRASGAGQESKLRSTLSVRPPVPLMTDVHGGNFTKSPIEVPITRHFRSEYRDLQTILSATPLGLAHGLDAYLQTYPNGCSEQISSGALCRLLLQNETDFGLKRSEVTIQLTHTWQVLRQRQNDQGAFGYWGPDHSPNIDFLSVYVMHFLIEAQDAGFDPPADMFQSGLRNLQRMVAETPSGRDEERTIAYAIYLLTREEVITTNYILNLRDHLDHAEGNTWHSDITGTYLAAAYAILKKDDEARDLITAYTLEGTPTVPSNDFYAQLGMDAQYVAIEARYFPDRLARITPAAFHRITGPIEDGEFNTLSAAYAVLALKSYSHFLQMNPPTLVTSQNINGTWQQLQSRSALLERGPFSPNAASLRFDVAALQKGPGAYYQTISTGFEAGLPASRINNGMEIFEEIRGANGKVATTGIMGEPLTVVLRIRSINGKDISNVSIVDLLPGGFEIANGSIQPGEGSAGCDYVDVREDRVLFYTSITPRVRTITYQIKPTVAGQFVVPPIFAESMYDRGIKARGWANRITIVKP